MPRSAKHLNPNPWTEEEDDLLWEHFRPGMPSKLLTDMLKRYGYDRTPTACRLRAMRMRREKAKQYQLCEPHPVEILANHRPWIPTCSSNSPTTPSSPSPT